MHLLIVTQKVDKNDENLGAFYYWFEEFAKRFEKVTIIASFVGEENLPENVRVFSLGKEMGYSKLRRIFNFFFLFGRCYFDADAVFFHMIPEFLIASSPFFIFSNKKIALWYAHKSVTWELKLAEKLADHIFASSESGFLLPSKKVVLTGQAINTNLFFPSSKRSPEKILKLVSIGRISPIKNYEAALKAVAVLKKSWLRDWTFGIVGGPITQQDRKYLSFLGDLVRDLGIEENVKFSGARPYPSMPDFLNRYDFLLNFSRTGSLDKIVLEAMACGLTVLTSTEGYKAVLPSEYFIGDSSDKQKLAETIRALADDERPNLELRGIVVKNHNLEKTIEKIVSVLSSK